MTNSNSKSEVTLRRKPVGFWTCWSLTVGIMIGSGIFLLPAVLAPYGMLSFAGWALTAAGSMCMALVIARLSARTKRSGGVYVYAQEAFGDLPGFLIAWGYWASYWIAIPAIAIAFVGYLGVFIPGLKGNSAVQAVAALGLIWTLTLINLRSLESAGRMQVIMTILKILPILLIIGLGAMAGSTANLPPVQPSEGSFLSILAAVALLTMWAFSGLEAGTVPAADMEFPEKTVPKAIVLGTMTVAVIYIASTYAVMLLVPAEQLVTSTSPFSDAAAHLGPWGPGLIAIGALVATAGALNGVIFVTGQLPMAVALDGLAPPILAKRSADGTPRLSLLLGASLGSALLMLNFSKGLIGMFTVLATMSTLTILVPMLVSAMAEFKHSRTSAKGWAAVAGLAALYSLFAIFGSGLSVLMWGTVLMAAGVPVYYWARRLGGAVGSNR